MNRRSISRLVHTAILLATGAVAPAAMYTVDEAPQGEEKIAPQHFNFYLPDRVKTVRAVIILQHGNANIPSLASGRDNNGFGVGAWEIRWRALADKWSAALVAPLCEGKSCDRWYDPANGGWRAVNAALASVGAQSGHPELADAPLCLWGFSCGGDWAGMMLKQHPARILAAVARSGGTDPGPAADGVPVLLIQGGKNDPFKNKAWFDTARPRGALVAFAEDADHGHEAADMNTLAIPFLDACLALRLAPTGTALRTIQPGNISVTNWFPNPVIAQKWSEFVNHAGPRGSTGWATDTTPPHTAPDEVAASVTGANVTLAWRATADLESGIQNFTIYRDNRKVGTLGGTADTSHGGHGFFQWGARWPVKYPVLPAPQWPFPATFTDTGVANGRHTYQIATVNGEGLEGPKSAPVIVAVGGAAGAPGIVTQPVDAHLVEGLAATFVCSASGTGPLTCQWQKNGVNIPGATNFAYTTPATTLANNVYVHSTVVTGSALHIVSAADGTANNGDVYSVVVTGPGGSATSRNASLSVLAGALPVALPKDATANGK